MDIVLQNQWCADTPLPKTEKDTRKLVLLLITKIFCFEVDDAVEQF